MVIMGRRPHYEYDTETMRDVPAAGEERAVALRRHRTRAIYRTSPYLTNAEIGLLLGISGQTVAKYLKRIKR